MNSKKIQNMRVEILFTAIKTLVKEIQLWAEKSFLSEPEA